ncbi:hypothetical protein [Streptomyces sp. NPDC088246]|uniref:hypothetical protein n=1 Tax=Streptomyces sp. NPDC088246 TaxID=3365842 RepID=UPI0038099DC7
MQRLLEHLEEFPGATWQERWEAAGLNERGRQAQQLYKGRGRQIKTSMNTAAGHAFAMRLLRPSLLAFRAYRFSNYVQWFRSIAKDSVLEAFCERPLSLTVSRQSILRAQFDVIVPLTVFGIDIADLTPEATSSTTQRSPGSTASSPERRAGTAASPPPRAGRSLPAWGTFRPRPRARCGPLWSRASVLSPNSSTSTSSATRASVTC